MLLVAYDLMMHRSTVVAVLLGLFSTGAFGASPSILWQNTNGDVVEWYLNGGRVTSSANLGVAPSGWQIYGTGDFGDTGVVDLLWRSMTTGDVVIWFMTGNIVINGGFDGTTYIQTYGSVTDVMPSGWNLDPSYPSSTSDINVVPATAYPGFPDPDGGGFYVAFRSQVQNGSEDCLYQDFNTVPGQTYTLSFKAAITSASPYLVLIPDWDELGTDRKQIAVNGFNVNTAPTSSSAPLAFQSFTFSGLTASLATTRLFFHGVDSQGAVLLDSVSVTPDTGIIGSSADLGMIPTSWSIAGTGDFNGDGKTDILWHNSNGDSVIWFMNGGTISSSTDLGVTPTSWSIAGVADFNGDGSPDILWSNSDGDTVIWFMNDGAITSWADLGVVPSGWSIADTGDFNNAGHADILWRNSNGDTMIWFIDGGTVTSSADLGIVTTSWTIAGVRDFNGDGISDILWRNSNGDTVIWFMNGGAIASSTDLGVVPTSWSTAGGANRAF